MNTTDKIMELAAEYANLLSSPTGASSGKARQALRTEIEAVQQELSEAFRAELDKVSQRNFELRMEIASLKATPTSPAQKVPQGATFAGWLREWEGDDSDLGQWLFAATEEDKDDSPNWRPVYWLNAAPTPPAQQEWIDDAGRLRWALWRIKDLEQQLSGRSAAIAPPSQSDDEHLLRLLLAVRVAGPGLYTDNGEMSDCSATPHIDFKRDGVKEIERKLIERGMAKAWGSIGELLATKTSADDQSDDGRS